jgi:hypothetical protein
LEKWSVNGELDSTIIGPILKVIGPTLKVIGPTFKVISPTTTKIRI